MDYTQLATQADLDATVKNLESNGFTVLLAENGEEAKHKALEIIPEGVEVMTMTSITLATTGIAKELDESGRYTSVRSKLNDPATTPREKKRLGSAPEWVIGSANAIAGTGSILNASNTGSQLAAYVHGADHVILVVGAQKIVPSVEVATKRIYEYVLPHESERARAAYNLPDFSSFVSKLLITNREVVKGRTTIILVKEALGF